MLVVRPLGHNMPAPMVLWFSQLLNKKGKLDFNDDQKKNNYKAVNLHSRPIKAWINSWLILQNSQLLIRHQTSIVDR
jgi:hypothetical protein